MASERSRSRPLPDEHAPSASPVPVRPPSPPDVRKAYRWDRGRKLTPAEVRAAVVLAQISKFVTAADGIRAGTCSLSGSTLIPMVQTANFWEGHDVAGGRLYGTRPRAVLAERKMCSGVMMVVKIAR
jgi:hypothetical protein